ncbi:MAG TPA: LysM peptidoglycan-binding domain-containing protein [Opitutaceae bacterium]|nr:LysM peptidoglycan-binding domain-containing protein [Opitutaceae bacterium]
MTTRSIILGLAALVALGAGPGCGGDAPSLSSELDDSNYREGQQLERQGRWDEALASYLKVIDRRGDGAPESNLDAGLIYLNHIRDPISAIYHFRKYLELEPNSKQAVFVRGMIDSAKREFARSLPGQPLESQTEHLGFQEQAARLQRENDELRAENAALRAGVAVPATHSSSIDLGSIPSPQSLAEEPTPTPSPAGGAVSPISLAPVAPGEGGASSAIADAPPETPAPQAEAPKPSPAPSARHHTVARGDTLFSLAQRYYGNRSKWRDIYAANREVLASENSTLKIGVELKIP